MIDDCSCLRVNLWNKIAVLSCTNLVGFLHGFLTFNALVYRRDHAK